MQKTCPYRRVSRLDRPPWPSQLFLHFLTKFGEQQEQNVGLASRVICLTRDHGQRKNERKENGKKDRLVTLLTRQTFLYILHWLWLAQLSLEGENQSMHELYFQWENWNGHFLARAKGSTFSCILLYTLDWAGRVLYLPRQLFSIKKRSLNTCP